MSGMLTLKEIQREELGILVDFDTFCKQNELTYSLDGGTLLGAIRHKGFIPWDDDIDVCMPRPDYEKFLKLAHALPEKYSVVTMRNSVWPQPFCKIQNHEFRAQEPHLEGIMEEYLWIDIFPFDGYIENAGHFSKSFRTIRDAVKTAARLTYGADSSASLLKRFAKRVLHFMPGRTSKIDDAKRLIEAELSKISYEDSKRVFCYANQFENMVVDKEKFETTVLLPFEDRLFPCMSCWDEMLRLHYGDYMQIPDESQRETHSMRCWRTAEGAE